MLTILNGLRDLSFWAILVRMLVAVLCGTLIGLERSSKNRPAGFRTHILVCLGAAVASITGLYLYLGLELPADISRISGQVVTGLGFIGAGTIIITKKMTIKGLTTAAGLWTTGVIGLAIGSGYYELGVLGTALVLITETGLNRISGTNQPRPEFIVEVLYDERNALDQVLRYCKDNRMSIVNLQIQSMPPEHEADYAANIKLRGKLASQTLVSRIQLMRGIVSAMEI